MTADPASVAAAKQSLRRDLLAARRARPLPDRAAAQAGTAAHLAAHLLQSTVVCAYLPLPTEPLAAALLDRLHAVGVRVLVPVVAADAPLDWVRYPSAVTRGAFGIAEPSGERCGPDAVAGADVVLVPALAVDRRGCRLGRGGGHYDRTLALLPPADLLQPSRGHPELIAVLFDGELLPEVPTDDHDIAVDAVVTPSGGLQRLAR